jgi:hypothetical protein
MTVDEKLRHLNTMLDLTRGLAPDHIYIGMAEKDLYKELGGHYAGCPVSIIAFREPSFISIYSQGERIATTLFEYADTVKHYYEDYHDIRKPKIRLPKED